ncbi:cation-translocating P-type ATPase family protein [Thalassoroseus pseudoceratinae]|uniref:cation-translocating P-type ATPase family protein n=1 Tax=Thalassoroseus pseudoceratinae TaxID=2713176 RepID=UPI00141EFDCD|nr:cation-translocating P-type ATPase family protein [Thalassoroseus pseudoceratinae]
MHYVPDSFREFLPTDSDSKRERSIHYRSAPLYLLTGIVLALIGFDLLFGVAPPPGWETQTVFGFRLAMWAALVGGSRLLYHTLDDLWEGKVGAGLALVIALASAILLGEYITAALVVAITLLGECLEGYTIDRAQAAIRESLMTCPATALVVRNGQEIEVSASEVATEDTVVVRPGDVIPVDGHVTDGSSEVDESSLSGESLPVAKTEGARVFAGTINQLGLLKVSAERTGEETTSARIAQFTREAAAERTATMRTADRWAQLFLPILLLAAVLTLIGWRLASGEWSRGFEPALAVLVVSCPCALVLATPTAAMAALAWTSKHGVVPRGTSVLERLAEVDTFAFDKTGTLTESRFAIARVESSEKFDETDVLTFAAALEQHCEHPLADAVCDVVRERGLIIPEVQSVRIHPGFGVTGETVTDGRQIVVGSEAFLRSRDVAITEGNQSDETIFGVAVDGDFYGWITLTSRERNSARQTLTELRALGVTEMVLLTGDHQKAADSLASHLGRFDEVHSGLQPEDKARWIANRQSDGRHVAMVGDGINDAPALAVASVGISVGNTRNELVRQAGDLLLLGDPLRPLSGLVRLSRAMVANIRQNILVFAFGLNILGVLLSATGWLDPVAAAILHEIGSLAVMLNAMRLLWFEPAPTSSLARWTTRLGQAADSVAQFLSPTRITFWFLDRASLLTRLAMAAVAMVWLSWNIVQIRSDESAFVTRFGRVEQQLAAGLYWRWPPPFENVYRSRTDEIHQIPIGFRPVDETQSEQTPDVDFDASTVEWVSEHHTDRIRSDTQESLILTGDEVPIELTAEVLYQIHDLQKFAFGMSGADGLLRAVSETEIRQLAAGLTLDEILTTERSQLERRCRDRIERRFNQMDLGLTVAAVRLLDVHPPTSVVAAYRDVADAMENREQLINLALEYESQKLLTVAGETAFDRLRSGLAGGSRTIDPAAWDAVTKSLTAHPEIPQDNQSYELAGQAARSILEAHADAIRTRSKADGESDRFRSLLQAYQQHPEETSFEIFWQTIEENLADREMTILDPAVQGRRRIWIGAESPLTLPGAVPRPESQPQVDAEHTPTN